jgi:ATP-binding cassette subfamily F protein uup
MDTIVDTLFVFEGDGNIRPFNGNYQEYLNEQEDIQAALYAAKSTTPKGEYKAQETKIEIETPVKRKLTFNEQRLFEQLEKELAQHHAKKLALENKLSEPSASNDDLMSMGKELIEVNNAIDEKELKWLELSELV